MKWDNFTAPRVIAFQCVPGKKQSIFWDGKTPGLGVRVTAAGAKSYIFETSLNGKTLRLTIGDVDTYTMAAARREADDYKAQTNKGIDPRQVRADALVAEQADRDSEQATAAALKVRQVRDSVTLGGVWPVYVAERSDATRKEPWSALHLRDHLRMIQAGGEKRQRSQKLTEPGPLASLAGVRLVDITSECVEAWAKVEANIRPTRARLALRLLKACLNWCAANKAYAGIVPENAAHSKKARESLGRPGKKNDVLEREQLTAWFAAVRQIENPVVAAYLQCLLLTGARREEVARLKWEDVDFKWNSLKLNDKVEAFRPVPLTPYVAHLLRGLKLRNDAPPTVRRLRTLETENIKWQPSEWVFSSSAAASGRLMDPSNAHRKACAVAGLDVTLHGLRRSFASLCEWTETPAGIAAQIQGHAPQGVREQNYIRRKIDLLRLWHVKIEVWILEQAGVDFVPVPDVCLASESDQRDTVTTTQKEN